MIGWREMKGRLGVFLGAAFYLSHFVPAALVLYGVWLGVKTHILWGLALLVTFPAWAVIGWTEILFGWRWLSPMWPFAIAGLWEVVVFALGLAVGAWLKRGQDAERTS